MLGIFVVTMLGILALTRRQTLEEAAVDLPLRLSEKLEKLWDIAQESLRDNKYLRAEKALLTILRVDERNATAYNRLGILYAKQKAYKEAIECFEIAQSLEPSASSLHNVGLIYFETGNYDKSALAFEQAISMENTLAARHIAYAKVVEKLGNTKKAVEALETAAAIEPRPQTLRLLADTLEREGNIERAETLRQQIVKMTDASKPTHAPRHVRQPRRVVM